MNIIASERARIGMSQDELAKRLGVTRKTVRVYEEDIRKARVSELVSMSALFGCTPDWLLGRTDTREVIG